MAKVTVKAMVEGGKAVPGPPLGPALATYKLNIGQVVQKINEATKGFAGIQVPIEITIDTDTKDFEIKVGSPPTSQMIKKELKLAKLAKTPWATPVPKEGEAPPAPFTGDLPFDKAVEIAKSKLKSLGTYELKKGVKEAGKKLTDVDVTAYASFSVHKQEEKAAKAAVPVVAFIVAGSPNVILERHDVDLKEADKIRGALKAGDFGQAFGSVSPEMIEAFSVCGTPDLCIEKINRLLRGGISQFVVGSPIGPNVRKSIDLISETIIPHFKK